MLALAAAACGAAASADGDSSVARDDPVALPPQESGVVTGPTSGAPDSLRLRLVVPPEARRGEPVPIVLRVENGADRPLELYLRGRTITFDVVVRAGTDTVWRRLEGEIIPAIVQLRVLAPAETLELRAVWNQQAADGRGVAAGDYTVQGLVLTEHPEPLATPVVPLRITRP